MKITTLLVWCQTNRGLQIFVLKWKDAEPSILNMEALSHSHYASEAYHTLKISQSFIVRSLQKVLEIMLFEISKQLFAKTVHARVKKL